MYIYGITNVFSPHFYIIIQFTHLRGNQRKMKSSKNSVEFCSISKCHMVVMTFLDLLTFPDLPDFSRLYCGSSILLVSWVDTTGLSDNSLTLLLPHCLKSSFTILLIHTLSSIINVPLSVAYHQLLSPLLTNSK